VPELHREGLVEAQIGTQLRTLLRRRVLPEQIVDRIADVLEQQEGDEGYRQHHDDGLGETADDEGKHAATASEAAPASRKPGSSAKDLAAAKG
jgi:hypothetical protein